MKLCLQAIQPKTFISLTLSAQKLSVCMRDRWWEMGKNAYVHAMHVQKERNGPSALNYRLIGLGVLHYLYFFQLRNMTFFIRVMTEFNLKSNQIKFLSPKKIASLHYGYTISVHLVIFSTNH